MWFLFRLSKVYNLKLCVNFMKMELSRNLTLKIRIESDSFSSIYNWFTYLNIWIICSIII